MELTREETESAMDMIMSGEVPPVKLAAWLTALRMKGETAAEIAGCASSMSRHAINIPCTDPNAIDIVGTGGDGAHTINISTAAAFVAAGAGITVAKHGNRAVSSKSGAADVLSALGVKVELTPEQMVECLKKTGMVFLYAPLLHPAMKYAMPVRRELGIRTIFNILGPLTNPAKVKRYVLGVYDDKLRKLIAAAAVNLGYERLLVVHGSDGLDEITISGPTYVSEVNGGKIRETKFKPEDFGMSSAPLEDIAGGDPAANASIVREILAGKLYGPKRDVVVMNAAAAIYVSGKADSLKQGVEMAKNAIENGAATEKLAEMQKFTGNC